MFLSAFAALHPPVTRTYYDKCRSRGKTPTLALLRLARQGLRRLPSHRSVLNVQQQPPSASASLWNISEGGEATPGPDTARIGKASPGPVALRSHGRDRVSASTPHRREMMDMALILVTGASSGLGRNTAEALADDGHDVVVHVRNAARVADAGETARWKGVVTGDLADLDEIRGVARQADGLGRFDAVIHNAGVMSHSDAITVNVVAPYLLTTLMDKPGRLIYLSSSMHRTGSTDLRRLSDASAPYNDTKLWVTALALAFAHRWEGTSSHAVDPGWVPTRMGGPGAPDDLVAGHRTQVWLATHP
jgi:NAD(P)-dependent dehydrogenase (short-subunit alcohol dehydrogenase family)